MLVLGRGSVNAGGVKCCDSCIPDISIHIALHPDKQGGIITALEWKDTQGVIRAGPLLWRDDAWLGKTKAKQTGLRHSVVLGALGKLQYICLFSFKNKTKLTGGKCPGQVGRGRFRAAQLVLPHGMLSLGNAAGHCNYGIAN